MPKAVEEEKEEEEFTPIVGERMKKLMRRSIALSEVKRKSFQEDRGKHLDDLEKHVRDHEMKEVLAEKDKLLQMKHDELEKVKQDKAELEKEAKQIRRKAEMQKNTLLKIKNWHVGLKLPRSWRQKNVRRLDCLQTLLELSSKSKMRRDTLFKVDSEEYQNFNEQALQQAWRRNMIRITLKLFTKPLLFLHILMMLSQSSGGAGRR